VAAGRWSAFGILVLLQTALGGWRLAATVFLGLVASLPGGVVTALANGNANYLAAFTAFSAVLGIAVRSCLLLAGEIRNLRAGEHPAAGQVLVIRAACERLKPTLVAVVTTAVALLPLVLLGGVAGTEVILPIAVIIWGGLLTTTLFVLFVLPAILLRFEGSRAGAQTATTPAEVTEARMGA
jgi:Cu/Ag efflux pump CusA